MDTAGLAPEATSEDARAREALDALRDFDGSMTYEEYHAHMSALLPETTLVVWGVENEMITDVDIVMCAVEEGWSLVQLQHLFGDFEEGRSELYERVFDFQWRRRREDDRKLTRQPSVVRSCSRRGLARPRSRRRTARTSRGSPAREPSEPHPEHELARAERPAA